MSQEVLTFPFSKGIDRTVAPLRSDPGSFYDLLNFKYSPFQVGTLIQTPYFGLGFQFSRGTYYDAGSQTEPTTSAIRMHTGQIVMTDYVFWNTGVTALQAFYQTTVPSAETIYTGLRLVINSVAGLAITLGSTLDVVIEGGGTTFKYRKNGGAYTTGVGITTAGVSIDGGNATLYFLAASGYTAADTWSWTRTDCAYDSLTNVYARPAQYVHYKNILYFTNTNTRVMEATTDGSSVNYVISVGYRPVYGTFLTFYGDHLILGGFSKTAVGYLEANRIKTIGWSDKTDIENFIPTDTNEADQYTFPNLGIYDTIAPFTPASWIIGVAVVSQNLFVFTIKEVYYTNDFGLPIVFDFRLFAALPLTNGVAPIIPAQFGVYICGRNDVYFFDGGTFASIGRSLTAVTNGSFAPVFGVWNNLNSELILIESKKLYGFQKDTNRWYTRNVDFNSDGTPITCIATYDNADLYVCTKDRKLLGDYDWLRQPVGDMTDGTLYTTPKITTQVVVADQLRTMKEVTSTYLGASVATVSSTYFSTAANVQAKLHWYISTDGQIAGTPATNASAVWVSTQSDGMISYPRSAFRALALEVQVNGLVNGKPPGQITITAIEPLIKNPEQKKVER